MSQAQKEALGIILVERVQKDIVRACVDGRTNVVDAILQLLKSSDLPDNFDVDKVLNYVDHDSG